MYLDIVIDMILHNISKNAMQWSIRRRKTFLFLWILPNFHPTNKILVEMRTKMCNLSIYLRQKQKMEKKNVNSQFYMLYSNKKNNYQCNRFFLSHMLRRLPFKFSTQSINLNKTVVCVLIFFYYLFNLKNYCSLYIYWK